MFPMEEHENFSLAWTTPEEMKTNWEKNNKKKDFDHWFYFLDKVVRRAVELDYDKTSK